MCFAGDLIKVPVRVSAGRSREVDIQPLRSAVGTVSRSPSELVVSRRRRRRSGRRPTNDGRLRSGGDRLHNGRRGDADRRSAGLSLRPAVSASEGTTLSVADSLPRGVQRGDCMRRCRQKLEMGSQSFEHTEIGYERAFRYLYLLAAVYLVQMNHMGVVTKFDLGSLFCV